MEQKESKCGGIADSERETASWWGFLGLKMLCGSPRAGEQDERLSSE